MLDQRQFYLRPHALDQGQPRLLDEIEGRRGWIMRPPLIRTVLGPSACKSAGSKVCNTSIVLPAVPIANE
jgi:hypothetical protein